MLIGSPRITTRDRAHWERMEHYELLSLQG